MTRSEPDFPYAGCPRYDGPNPQGARPYDPDCCAAQDCPQRDYNRACLLALENLSRAYASLHLVRSASSRLWHCDEDGHTADCPHPSCRFAEDMAVALDRVRVHFAVVVRDLCKVLTIPSTDISGQWQEFVDTEQIRDLVEGIALADAEEQIEDQEGMIRTMQRLISAWRVTAVTGDEIEYARWFTPPADEDAPPN